MSDILKNVPLDKKEAYISTYTPELLFAIPRKSKRDEIGVPEKLPFHGRDYWMAYEISWLNLQGKPQIAWAQFSFPCDSECIIESKSMKLYLNSFNQSRYASMTEVEEVIRKDYSVLLNCEVEVKLFPPSWDKHPPRQDFTGICVDGLEVETDVYQVNANLLKVEEEVVDEAIYSHLLKSNCLVTHQPDWAAVWVHYVGKKIDHTSFLKYIISFREHYEFHEQCIERIYMDILNHCKPEKLTVFGKYSRRGGIEIEPYRSNFESAPQSFKIIRQ